MTRRLWAKLRWCKEGKVVQDFQLSPAEIWEIHVRKDPFWDQNSFSPSKPWNFSKYESPREVQNSRSSHLDNFFFQKKRFCVPTLKASFSELPGPFVLIFGEVSGPGGGFWFLDSFWVFSYVDLLNPDLAQVEILLHLSLSTPSQLRPESLVHM